ALKKLGAVLDVIGQIGTDPGSSWPVAGTTVGTVDHTLIRKLSVCSPNAVNLSSFGTDATNSEWIVYASDGELGQLGSYAGCSSTPSLTISSPATATIFNPLTTSVNISLAISNFNVASGTGDGHIHYTVNNGSVVMKYDTAPIALTSLTPGNYTVYVELVNNSHAPISPAVNATVTFTIAAYNVVADLAALRADVVANGAGKYYQVSSNPVVTYTRVIRNQKYVQDTSGGILIDDNVTAPGVISTTVTAGDAISGLKGQASLFNGFLQLLPLENVTVASSGNTITPQVVTIAELNSAVTAATYESELVQINGVTFDTTTANFPLSTDAAANINLTIGSDVLIFRTAFSEANYMGTAKPTSATNIIALVGRFNTTAQVTSRNLTDLNAPLSSSSFDNINGLTMYPNPVSGNTLYLTSTANAAMSVQIFDLLGKEVLKATVVNNAVNVSGLNAGVYMVKVTEEGKTATRKLVIQ
ncbi:T9SS type A sorting domain-containing protein, partial [Flavobacterium sp.]|uniref:T9SS type A sorting domain-containing protein n=1 Tax=Flavobacterium sp. TaxID=239 RepID=UPI0037C0D3E9